MGPRGGLIGCRVSAAATLVADSGGRGIVNRKRRREESPSGALALTEPTEYDGGMRVKTSVTLPNTLLEEIDRAHENRSAFLELAARSYLDRAARLQREARDAEILNRQADRLNREAGDVLEYQDLSY